MNLRFSVRTLLLLVFLVCVGLTSWSAYRGWYVKHYTRDFLQYQLNKVIRNGATVSDVAASLGANEIESLDAQTQGWIRQNCARRQIDVRVNDQFLRFHTLERPRPRDHTWGIRYGDQYRQLRNHSTFFLAVS